MKNKLKVFGALFFFLATALFFKVSDLSPQVPIIGEKNAEIVFKVAGDVDNIGFVTGETLYQVMSRAQEGEIISFSAKEYGALGFFIEEVGGLRHGDGGNLMYYVNDEEALVGVSNYKPNDGDVIEWKLK